MTPAALYGAAPIQGISPTELEKMRTQAAALSRSGHAGFRCAWTSVALHTGPVATYARAVSRQWAALYHGQAANRQQLASACDLALARQNQAATPAMTTGPAGATILFLRLLGIALQSAARGCGSTRAALKPRPTWRATAKRN